jgi:hypothetical protein
MPKFGTFMKWRLFRKPLSRALLLGAITPLTLALLWLGKVSAGFSIFPTDTYGAYKGWYEPGNAAKVTNHYSLDINFIYFPWKYYLATHSIADLSCETSAPPLTLGHYGVKLPDGSCFPLATSRHYTVLDPRRCLEKVLPFFVGYDLGYLLLGIAVWLSVLAALWRMQFGLVPMVLGAAVSLGTFWLSKELQYDQYSVPAPFLYLAMACLVGAEKGRIPKWRYGLFGGFVFLVLLSTSLQGVLLCGVGFAIVLIGYFVARDWPRYRDFWGWVLLAAGIAYAVAIWLISPSIGAFLDQSQRYVSVTSPVQELILVLKRVILPVLILVMIPTGNMLGSFDTIDPWKILGSFGGREYVSGDTLTNYNGSLYALLLIFVALFTWQNYKNWRGLWRSPALRFWGVCFGLAWLVCVLPTYKLVYFRLFQFTLGLGAPIFVAFAVEQLLRVRPQRLFASYKLLVVGWVSLWGLLWISSRAVKTFGLKPVVLRQLGQGGILGFEPGFWEQRYERFLARLSLQDRYAITLLCVQLLLLFLLYLYLRWARHPRHKSSSAAGWVTGLIVLQSILIGDSAFHTWIWNQPQVIRTAWILRNPYWQQFGVQGLTEPSPDNAPTPAPNFLILYGYRPPFFYESLDVDRRIRSP